MVLCYCGPQVSLPIFTLERAGRSPLSDELTLQQIIEETSTIWFWMLVSYLKVKTLELWLRYYPETSYQNFELVWPRLFDQMLSQSTSETARKLRERVGHSDN